MPALRALDHTPRLRASVGAAKVARYRARQRAGLSVLRLIVPQHDCVSYLIETGRITPAEALNRLAVERAASDALVDLVRRWAAENL